MDSGSTPLERKERASMWAGYRISRTRANGTYGGYGAVPLQQNEQFFPEPTRHAIEHPTLRRLVYAAATHPKYGRRGADATFIVRETTEDERDILARSLTAAEVLPLGIRWYYLLFFENRANKSPILVRDSSQKSGSSLSHS